MTEKDRKIENTVELNTFKQKTKKIPCINYKQVNLFFTSNAYIGSLKKLNRQKVHKI